MVSWHHRALVQQMSGGGGGPVVLGVASMTDATPGGATRTLTLPVANTGDLIIINNLHFRFSGSLAAPTTPTGFTLLRGTTFTSGVRTSHHQISGRIKQVGDAADISVPGDAGNGGVQNAIRVTGVTTITPDATGHAQNAVSGTGVTGESVTTTGAARLLLAIWATESTGDPANPTGTGWTQFGKEQESAFQQFVAVDIRDAPTAALYTGPTRTAQQLSSDTIFSCTTLALF